MFEDEFKDSILITSMGVEQPCQAYADTGRQGPKSACADLEQCKILTIQTRFEYSS
jgi:hypothetical protein